MSGLRDNLGEWARAHGARVAATVADQEVGVRASITKRRRNRALASAATAAAVMVGVVAIASALPGIDPAPPADGLPRHLSELVCGDAWVVQSGTTDFVAEPEFYYSAPSGDWVLTDDDGDTHTGFSGFTVGLGSVSWQGDMELRHHAVVRSRVVAVKGGTIVGVTEEQYPHSRDDEGANIYANAPRPGGCGDTTAGKLSGKVTYHLVLQVRQVDDDSGPVATLVDPGGAKTVALDGVETWLRDQSSPSLDPHTPQGDVYQAFLMRRPTEASCTPYQDLIAEGNPLSSATTYDVTITGVQPLERVLFSDAPVVNTDANMAGTWLNAPGAWLVLGAGSNPTRPLAWNTAFTSLAGSDDAPRPPAELDCAGTFQYERPDGAVYLIINGVDWDALYAQNPALDLASATGWQTWVYLGRADSIPDPHFSLGLP